MATTTVRTVFSCVASRNTQRVSYWPSGGENSSPRVPSGTEPRPGGRWRARPTVAVAQLTNLHRHSARKTAPKGRAPRSHPRRRAHISVYRSAANPSRRKFGPSPTPLRLCKTPVGVPSGTDRAGDLKVAIVPTRNSAGISLRRPTPPPYGPDCCWKTAIADRAPLRRPPRRAQLRCCSAGYGAVSEKTTLGCAQKSAIAARP